MKIFPITIFLFLLASSALASAGSFEHFSKMFHGRKYNYSVYLPDNYDATREWPMILFLHGSGQCGIDGIAPTQGGLALAVEKNPDRFPAVIVYSQIPCGQTWKNTAMVRMAAAELGDALVKFHGDSRRIYLTGLSLGGFGAWLLASEEASKFAAAVPIAGGGDPRTMARALRDMPIWAFHGSADQNVPVTRSRQMVAALRAEGNTRVRYTEYPGVGHDSWDLAYGDPELSEWLFEQHN